MAIPNTFEVTKQPHKKTRYTPEQMYEFHMCMQNPVYFMRKFIKVKHATKGQVPFDLYDYQEEMIDSYMNYNKVVTLTGRQLGKTETTVAFLLWYAMFIPDSTILIAANVYKQALEIMRRIRYAYEGVPDHIRAGAKNYAKEYIEFDNGSIILSQATTENTGRGLSISVLYIDEFAFVPPNMAEAFWTSIQPTLSTGGKCFVTSTPNSDVDQFSQIWRSAEDTTDEYGRERKDGLGKNGFKAIKVKWDRHPERDEAWAADQRETIGEKRFEREHECSFITVDETLIEAMTLTRLEGRNPLFEFGKVRFYEQIEPNYIYLVALDPSYGTGGDNAAIQIYRLPDMVQVGEWMHNETRTDGQVRVLMQILHYLYSELKKSKFQQGEPDIYWTLENNSMGEGCLRVIEDTGEERFPGEFVHEPFKRGSKKFRKGLHTNIKTKATACVKLKSLIERDVMKVRSKNLVRELKNFVAKGMSFEAKQGEKDDLVSATLLCVRLMEVVQRWDENFDERLKDIIEVEDSHIEPMPISILSTI